MIMEQKKITSRQKEFLEVFENSSCNISVACKKFKITRQTYYNWLENPKFKQEIIDIEESLIDYAETKLMQNIKEGKESSIFFFLKTKGKKRGYIETVEQNVSVNPFIELMKQLPDDAE